MSGFIDRENQIFEVLQRFQDEGLDFVVVGGYGVSAYQHRFSVDADLVIKQKDVEEFTTVLEEQGFEKESEKDLVYSGRYLAYVKNTELPVTIDLLVDEFQCRQTDASWNYRYFQKHSEQKEIEGSEKTVQVQVPTKELLTAVKLHSGRLTDARDAVALIENTDLREVEKHIQRGNQEKLRDILENIQQTISDSQFEDSFKGVFSQQNLPENQIQKLQQFIQQQTG
ncbi:nucleotidyltransferase domain-containing protein [Halovenus marina]|uniref:nucleotidyltransferase domain-containing protein n=1 Tax=Halovenus marina TaxID=3396621 RepID=UPI003F573996